jgi:NhaP-type Na+/H+ or K+/H+ antiporter
LNPELLRLIAIIAVGIVAQWLAWRIKMPSILLLLTCGIVAGPVTGFLNPDMLFGDVLLPIVSLSVAVILFEGGLSLHFDELRQTRAVVLRVAVVGSAITWAGAMFAGHAFLDLPWNVAAVLGAVFIVTGPTVVGPMLRMIRPSGGVGSVLKWEGIISDPIGAVLAVLLFEALLHPHHSGGASFAVMAVARTLFLGGGVGLLGAWLLHKLLRLHLLPEYLQNPWTLMMVFVVYGLGQSVQEEAGLLSVTVMGMALGNFRGARIHHIVEFKEDLQVLLISGLFVLLAARLDVETLSAIGWRHLWYVLALILCVRPLAVIASTLGSRLNWPERIFMMAMAPRGIVSAAVASVLGLQLVENSAVGGEQFVPVAFSVIVGTVLVYGIGAPIVARALGLSDADPKGFLILGAHEIGRMLGKSLSDAGCRVVLIDSNRRNVARARLDGLSTVQGNILAEGVVDGLDLRGIGRFMALTSNDEVNSLACIQVAELLGSSSVYQLVASNESEGVGELGGRRLFGDDVDYWMLDALRRQGAELKTTPISHEFNMESYHDHYGEQALPLLSMDESGQLNVFVSELEDSVGAGQKVISLVLATPEAPQTAD